jgi:hypothetical protein
MLNLVVGRSALERGKAAAILLLAGLLAISLWQVSADRALGAQENEARSAASALARQFALALTTYDYAHPDLQLINVQAVSSQAIRDRVRAASIDLVTARASSVGEVTEMVVISVSIDRVEVLTYTSQVVSGSYVSGALSLTGLLDIIVSKPKADWVITGYQWLLPPEGR